MKDQENDAVKNFHLAKGRGKETLFRIAVRNQIELIAIADNKANIITGINVLLIPALIYLVSNQFSIGVARVTERVELVIPLGLLALTCVTSAVFAILAAKPKIVKGSSASSSSKLFFQTYYRETLEDYVDDMFDVLRSNESIYRNLIIDMYNNGLVLHRKYMLLDRSYSVFMYGLITTVGTFIVLMIAKTAGAF